MAYLAVINIVLRLEPLGVVSEWVWLIKTGLYWLIEDNILKRRAGPCIMYHVSWWRKLLGCSEMITQISPEHWACKQISYLLLLNKRIIVFTDQGLLLYTYISHLYVVTVSKGLASIWI